MDKNELKDMYDRLEWALEQLQKPKSVASKELGYKSKNSIREVLDREKKRDFTSTLLVRLAETYNISPNWLLLAKGDAFLE